MRTMRDALREILSEKDKEINSMLKERMKDGPPENDFAETFRKKTEDQGTPEMPNTLEDAIMRTPITTIIGIDQRTKRPIYKESLIGEEVYFG